jgi:hypothetical protein
MTGEELFAIWAPDEMIWSAWAKPVLFAAMQPFSGQESFPEWRTWEIGWAPRPESQTAIVLDLPGVESVVAGLGLAAKGHFPVPLFNAMPHFSELVPTSSIRSTLMRSATDRSSMRLPAGAPPVFLLDSARSGGNRIPVPGVFDNRWVVFPQDFPSANALRAAGIGDVLLVQRGTRLPADDLAHVLLRWQEGGLSIRLKLLTEQGDAQPLTVRRPSNFRQAWYRTLVLLGLRRSSAGGFGGIVPEPSQSHGGYG